jgi:hypothetical protein
MWVNGHKTYLRRYEYNSLIERLEISLYGNFVGKFWSISLLLDPGPRSRSGIRIKERQINADPDPQYRIVWDHGKWRYTQTEICKTDALSPEVWCYLYERTCCSPRYGGNCIRGRAVARGMVVPVREAVLQPEVWWYLYERTCCSPSYDGTCMRGRAAARGVVSSKLVSRVLVVTLRRMSLASGDLNDKKA